MEITKQIRQKAMKLAHSVVAARFASRICHAKDWKRDAAIKNSMAQFLNQKRESCAILKTGYPKPLTAKWFAHPKNGPEIERLARMASQT